MSAKFEGSSKCTLCLAVLFDWYVILHVILLFAWTNKMNEKLLATAAFFVCAWFLVLFSTLLPKIAKIRRRNSEPKSARIILSGDGEFKLWSCVRCAGLVERASDPVGTVDRTEGVF